MRATHRGAAAPEHRSARGRDGHADRRSAASRSFPGFINFLMLSGSIYMLQIYDRVLSSRSVSTLIGISLIILAAYILQGALDTIRQKMLARVGARFDEILSPRIFDLVTTLPLKGAKQSDSMQPIRDLDQIRGFLSGMGPTAFFDMPFMPIFFAGCFLIHPWIGWLSIFGGIIIICLTLLTEARSRGPMSDLNKSIAERHVIADTSRRNAEAVRALGMRGFLAERFAAINAKHVNDGLRAANAASGIGVAGQGVPHGAAILGPRPRRLSRHPPGDVRRLDDRRLDPDVARARADRGRGGELEGLRLRPPGLSPAPAHPLPRAGAGSAPQPAGADLVADAAGHLCRPAGLAAADRAGRRLPDAGRPGPRADRSERLGQVDPGALPRRRLADPARRGPPRRRHPRPVGAGRARPPYRLPAAGRRAVRRHASPRTSPASSRTRRPRRSSPPPRPPARTT